MKSFLTLIALSITIVLASAQEKIATEQLEKISPKIASALATLKDLQFKIEPDISKASGLKAGDVGIVVFPDKSLTAARIEKAGKEIVPIGQLYLKGVAPEINGKPTDNDRMHILMLQDKEQTHRVWLCLLGVRKNGEKLELVVYGSEKAPLLHVALRKSEEAADAPIEVSGEKRDDKSANLTLNVLGKHKATFVIMIPDA